MRRPHPTSSIARPLTPMSPCVGRTLVGTSTAERRPRRLGAGSSGICGNAGLLDVEPGFADAQDPVGGSVVTGRSSESLGCTEGPDPDPSSPKFDEIETVHTGGFCGS
jgi:hypothetical protein